MSKTAKISLFAASLAVAASVAAVIILGRQKAEPAQDAAAETERPKAPGKETSARPVPKASVKMMKNPVAKFPPVVATEDRDDLSADEKRLMSAIEDAMDEENYEMLEKVIPEATVSPNAEIRSDLVDAIGWFGEKGINKLLPFMADSDPDIRESAIDYWTGALSEIASEKTRASVIGAAMMVVDDEDALEEMTMELTDMDELVAIQTIVDVVESKTAPAKAVAAAREEYEFITGEEYTTLEDANKWMAENYEPETSSGEASGGE